MDKSFDLVALLKQQPTAKSHKSRPTQFVSVAGGVQKRLETNIKNRKSSRLSVFDRIRNIAKCESPKAHPLSDTQQKALHRKQQLEKWKEEKEKKKKEAAALKKKPFVAGVSQRKSFGPPPPPKPQPSTSSRVTRYQARQKIQSKLNPQIQSFAPSNASFKPPQFLNADVPTLVAVNKKKTNKPTITFEPVLPKTLQRVETRITRARPATNKPAVDSKTRKPNEQTKAKATIPPQKPPTQHTHIQSSSSSSDMEQKKTSNRSKPSQRKSISKEAPNKQNAFQSTSSSDMEEKTKLRSKPNQRKSIPEAPDAPNKHNAFQSSSSSDMPEMTNLRNKSTQRRSIPKAPDAPNKHNALQSSSSSDMEEKTNLRSKPDQRKSIPKEALNKQNDFQSSSSSDMQEMTNLRNKSTQRRSIPKAPDAPNKHNALQSSSSSDMEEKTNLRSKPNQRKSISKANEPARMSQDSASTSQDSGSGSISSQDSVEMLLQDTVPMVYQDTIPMVSQDTVPMVSQEESLSTPRNKVPRSESSSEEKLRSPIGSTPERSSQEAKVPSPTGMTQEEISKELKLRSPIGLTPERSSQEAKVPTPTGMTPEQISEEVKKISPCVTLARGKDNARREMMQKLHDGLLDEDSGNIDSVNHFRRQLDSEIARMTALCDVWDQVYAQTVLPEPIQELVLTAVGQARLLMSQKLQQFSGLVERCARPAPAAAPVTPADLHGFWDMVFMQIENVDMRFKKLEELRLADWIEEKQPSAKKVVAKPQAKKVAKPSGAPSRIREMIAAARKAMKAQESQSENSDSEKSEVSSSSAEVKTFEAGFFSITSPLKRGSTPSTPANKCSLLKSVLSSEAKKSVSKNLTSFAMLRASLKSKDVDMEGVSPLMSTPVAPINLYATPSRSILKINPTSTKTDRPKTVLFHEADGAVPSSPASYVSCSRSPEPGVSGVAPLAVEEKENKPTPRRPRLSRHNAEDLPSPERMMTRSRRKSAQTPLAEADANVEPKRRSTRKAKEVQEVQEVVDTPKRSTRRRRTATAL